MEKDKFFAQLQEVNRTRDEYLETKKTFNKLYEKLEKCHKKLAQLEKKSSLWSSLRYLFLYRRVLGLWKELDIEKDILDMRLDKWQSELGKLKIQ